jgi:hypothetical protein
MWQCFAQKRCGYPHARCSAYGYVSGGSKAGRLIFLGIRLTRFFSINFVSIPHIDQEDRQS